jgi:hypothetical protein
MKSKIIKTASIIAGVFFALVIILAVHIYMVTRPKSTNMIQLSRLDFKQTIDSAEANKITGFVGHLPGVQKAYFNPADSVLIYGYIVGKQNSTTVYDDLMAYGHYKAVKFVVDPAMVAKGCPVFDKSSFTYRISAFLSKIFH